LGYFFVDHGVLGPFTLPVIQFVQQVILLFLMHVFFSGRVHNRQVSSCGFKLPHRHGHMCLYLSFLVYSHLFINLVVEHVQLLLEPTLHVVFLRSRLFRSL